MVSGPASNNSNDDDDDDPSRIATAAITSYQRIDTDNNNDRREEEGFLQPDPIGARRTLGNFIVMSVLFGANHGCVVSCLGIASARLGSVGAWQSAILMMTYAASALLGSTYIVKRFGPRNSMCLGMLCYCAYVGCFFVATHDNITFRNKELAAYSGAVIGGIGAGFLWVSQGAYFLFASQDHAQKLQRPVEESTASLAGYFAFLYLSEEVALKLLSSVLLEFEICSWAAIFKIYTIIAFLSTLALPIIYEYRETDDNDNDNDNDTNNDNNNDNDNDNDNDMNNNNDNYMNTNNDNNVGNDDDDDHKGAFYKVTAALRLLVRDPKMKYMIGLNAVFGFTAAFLNSYINGQVVPVALHDPDSKYIGLLSSVVPMVAAGMSLFFGRISPIIGKDPILIFGALCFGGVVLPFIVQPDAGEYGWAALIAVYSFHGTGRATFEGTLRATFADYFAYENEGAFANIILQNGIASGVGYILTFALLCETPSRYCIEYNDGTLHDVWTFELLVIVSAFVAIVGYLRASFLQKQEQLLEYGMIQQQQNDLQNNQTEESEDNIILLERNEYGIST